MIKSCSCDGVLFIVMVHRNDVSFLTVNFGGEVNVSSKTFHCVVVAYDVAVLDFMFFAISITTHNHWHFYLLLMFAKAI